MSRQSYALIKWIDKTKNKNKYTSDIPVEWISNFDETKFRASKIEANNSYVIEWRDSKHKPKKGWKVYDEVVIEVSSKIK